MKAGPESAVVPRDRTSLKPLTSMFIYFETIIVSNIEDI